MLLFLKSVLYLNTVKDTVFCVHAMNECAILDTIPELTSCEKRMKRRCLDAKTITAKQFYTAP